MRRFFKSAWFPLLIVVVLAFFAHQLISPGQQEETPRYDEFISQIEDDPDSIDQVTIQTKDHTVDVKEADGGEYSTGYPENTEETLVNSLQRQDIPTEVEGTGGSSILSLLTKPERRRVDLPIRYVGFEIPNRFAIGYGLDHGQRYRNLRYVAALQQ